MSRSRPARCLALLLTLVIWDAPVRAEDAANPTDAAPAATAAGSDSTASSAPWPLDIPVATGVVTLYQPQPEKLTGNVLTGRAAFSFLATGKPEEERAFGALWLQATLDIDREQAVARARSLTITKVMTPKGERDGTDRNGSVKLVTDAILARGLEMDLDRLAATLEEPTVSDGAGFSTTPPKILIRTTPTVLVVLDGKPMTRPVGGVTRVVNTPAFLAIDDLGAWWLRGEDDWLTAPTAEGPWTLPAIDAVPAAIKAAAKEAGFSGSIARIGKPVAPAVVLATEPTALVVFDGQPAFVPVGADGALLGADNSDTPALVEVATGRQFLLLSGRWFAAGRLAEDATWTLVPPDQLPTAFASIPTEGDFADLREHVPGTPEADAAVAEAQIPQTARIPRSASITIAYDGEPRWERIDDLTVEYATNTADAVFRLPGPTFYACRDGVWYQGSDPRGPLAVTDSVPEALRQLPANTPWHNVSYAQVYESDADYVWCGYTPAYLGWYSWYGCPVYGTGWWYRGWYGPIVYPRPVTWGVGVRYNPYTGWTVGVGVRGPNGFAIGIVSGGTGWYGCGGAYRPGVYAGPAAIAVDRTAGGARPALYSRVPGAERPQLATAGDRLRSTPAAATGAVPLRRDNLAVDRDGTIGRPTADGRWQTRQDGTWTDRPMREEPARPASQQRPQQRPQAPAQRPQYSNQGFERTQQMRQQGDYRANQRSAPTRSGGGGRGGGGGGGRGR